MADFVDEDDDLDAVF